MQARAWLANASFSSTTSRSPIATPARSRALRVAATGPMPMMSGAQPATATARDAREHCQAVAPRVILAAHQHGGGAIGQRRRRARGDAAVLVECGLQAGKASLGGVGPDAAVLSIRPLPATGTISSANRPSCCAAAARWWLRSCERLLLGARDLPLPRDVLRRLAHADVRGWHLRVQRRVGQRVEAHHRHPRSCSRRRRR